MNDYPDELRSRALPFVIFLGNAGVHGAIIQNLTFISDPFNPIARPCFNIKELEFGSLSIPPKLHNPNDITPPQGIFKKYWIQKYTSVIPSVIVIFFTWDPVRIKDQDVINQVEAARQSCRGRNTKILLLLFQNSITGDPMEERLNAIKKRLELNEKSLFMFTLEDFKNSTKRFEKLVQELAYTFYREESLRIRRLIDTKRTHLPLLVSYNFKIAFFNEIREDYQATLKHYNAAYGQLREIVKEKTLINEAKAVADFINFKICLICLANDRLLQDATSQFQKHIKTYKGAIKNHDKEYEHWEWVSRQYVVFGDLLELSPFSSTQSVGVLHPGYYYQAAATFTQDRRKQANRICSIHEEGLRAFLANPPAPQFSPESPYLGQDPLFQETSSIDLFYRQLSAEQQFDHSKHIIFLLTKAHLHYKKTNRVTTRLTRYLAASIGFEHFYSGSYTEAKKFFDKIGSIYRSEKWWYLLTSIVKSLVVCNRQLSLTPDYIESVIDLCRPHMLITQEERMSLFDSLLNFLNSSDNSLPPLTQPLNLSLSQNDLLFARIQFVEDQVLGNEPFQLRIQLNNNFPSKLNLESLKICFSNDLYNTLLHNSNNHSPQSSTNSADLSLLPAQPKTLSLHLTALSKELLFCTAVVFQLKGEGGCIYLRQNIEFNNTLHRHLNQAEFVNKPRLSILYPTSHLTAELVHKPPALVNEEYPVFLHLKNEGDSIISGTISLEVRDGDQHQTTSGGLADTSVGDLGYFLGSYSMNKDQKKRPIALNSEKITIQLPAIASGEETDIPIYLQFGQPSRRKVSVTVLYRTNSLMTCKIVETQLSIVLPFELKSSFLSGLQTAVTPASGSLVVFEPFFLSVEASSSSPSPLVIRRCQLSLEPNLRIYSSSFDQEFSPQILHFGDKFTIWFCLSSSVIGDLINVGTCCIEWDRQESLMPSSTNEREDGQNQEATTGPQPIKLETVIQPIKVTRSPFSVTMDVPPQGEQGAPLQATLSVRNHTPRIEEFSLVVNESESFQFGGSRVSSFSILPASIYVLSFLLVPIKPGRVPLPSFQIVSKRFGKELPGIKHHFIFIKPITSLPPQIN
eukprot:TRINITY_DN14889_c0_g1_i1.p1 TRINITY_DN14889_c0_g1~~TRINITY_DN14889_c0_g1_i1.p1  ORF type:complete len:1082 (+),score=250.15 TRINITY_DN14889_c0_g1_i1:7-3252(+)